MNDRYAHDLYRCNAHGKRYCAECIEEAMEQEKARRRAEDKAALVRAHLRRLERAE